MIRSRLLFLALILSPFTSMAPVHAHGSHGGGSELEAGEFDFTPLLTVEGHAGFDDNLEIPEKHYAADFLIGGEFAWGLGNDKQFSLSAFVGPALVRGGAEHFYGEIHVEEEGHEHEAHPVRNRVVDFGLGDSFSDLIDGLYVSVDHRQGWGVDGVFIGNYTDPRLGVGFNYGEIAFQVEGGPRFYTPGKYASALNSRTDWAGEVMISRPVSDKVDFFAHWKFIHTWDNAEGWGDGYQHHIGTGITYKL